MTELKEAYVVKHMGGYLKYGNFEGEINSAERFSTIFEAREGIKRYCGYKFAENKLVFEVIHIYIY